MTVGYESTILSNRDQGVRRRLFTTWQRTDGPEEELSYLGPVPRCAVLAEARALVEDALVAEAPRSG